MRPPQIMTCRRCGRVYEAHVLACRISYWVCYNRLPNGTKCMRINAEN